MLSKVELPNVRKLFLPDPGFIIADCDLDRADLQVVVWEADDAELKAALRMGVDLHCFNACSIFGIAGIPVDELVESHPNYRDHRARIGEKRRFLAKGGCHAVNYDCKARTLAAKLGTTVYEAQKFIDNWLSMHPGILSWHNRIGAALAANRTITNAFGFRRVYFDRIDGILSEALAWIPQSTVAIVTNMGLLNLHRNLPEVQPLLQVHDSLVFQYDERLDPEIRPRIREQLLITIPYPDPLIIPVGLKTSRKSWGDCHDTPWEEESCPTETRIMSGSM